MSHTHTHMSHAHMPPRTSRKHMYIFIFHFHAFPCPPWLVMPRITAANHHRSAKTITEVLGPSQKCALARNATPSHLRTITERQDHHSNAPRRNAKMPAPRRLKKNILSENYFFLSTFARNAKMPAWPQRLTVHELTKKKRRSICCCVPWLLSECP